MINIDKYIDAVLGKFAQTQEDFRHRYEQLEANRKRFRLDFHEMDIEEEPRYKLIFDKLNKDEFELMEKWLSQHPTHFNKERKRVYNEWLSEYEKEKEINPFSEAYFINDNINLIETSINDSPMLPIVKAYVTDWEEIDFKELASLAGKIDFYNYLKKAEFKISTNDNVKISTSDPLNRLERMILFYYMVKANIVLSQRISQDDKKQSFIIGLLIGQSADYKQYQDNNTMRKDWAKIQKEMANLSPSNTFATRKRLEKIRDTLMDYKDFNTIKSLIISDLKKLF